MNKKIVKKNGAGLPVESQKDSTFSTIKISSQSKRVYVRTRRRTFAFVVALFLFPWIVLGTYFLYGRLGYSKNGAENNATMELSTGPWGTLECYEMLTSPPHDYIKPELFPILNEEWLFKGHSREGLETFLDKSEVSAATRATLMSSAENVPGIGWKLRPDDALIFSLSAKQRAAIYTELARHIENTRKYDPFIYNSEKLEKRLADGKLKPETLSKLKMLLYTRGNRTLLADIVPLIKAIPDEKEKNKLLEVLLRRVSYMLKLRVDSDSDVEALINYWGGPSRDDEVEPLLRSLSELKAGQTCPISKLLPSFAQVRLHTYPRESFAQISKRRDCHWSSLNFFNEIPDDKFTEPEAVRQALANDYQKVEASEIRMGDLALLTTPEGKAVHTSVYIAGKFYFSKNGPSHISPWIFVKLEEVMDAFPAHENLSVSYYRLKKATPVSAN